MSLLEWLANSYKGFGAGLEIITDRSQEGAQFVRGFGGIGGRLGRFLRFLGVFEIFCGGGWFFGEGFRLGEVV